MSDKILLTNLQMLGFFLAVIGTTSAIQITYNLIYNLVNNTAECVEPPQKIQYGWITISLFTLVMLILGLIMLFAAHMPRLGFLFLCSALITAIIIVLNSLEAGYSEITFSNQINWLTVTMQIIFRLIVAIVGWWLLITKGDNGHSPGGY